jgi:hypothetical protein
MLAMFDTRHDLSLCGTGAREFVGDHHARCGTLLLQQLPHQALGCFCVTPALNQDVEHGSVLVNGSPQPMLLAADADRNLIKVPLVTGYRQTPADLTGKALSEFQRLLPHGLVAD